MALSAMAVELITEAGISVIQGYFSMMKATGKTEQEIDEIYNMTKAEFAQRSPDKLVEPPSLEGTDTNTPSSD